jgi:hypothetical protein
MLNLEVYDRDVFQFLDVQPEDLLREVDFGRGNLPQGRLSKGGNLDDNPCKIDMAGAVLKRQSDIRQSIHMRAASNCGKVKSLTL